MTPKARKVQAQPAIGAQRKRRGSMGFPKTETSIRFNLEKIRTQLNFDFHPSACARFLLLNGQGKSGGVL